MITVVELCREVLGHEKIAKPELPKTKPNVAWWMRMMMTSDRVRDILAEFQIGTALRNDTRQTQAPELTSEAQHEHGCGLPRSDQWVKRTQL